MAETLPYPSIAPDSFDLIVVGTGLSESILAAAASANGKSVLHLDPNSFYGSHSSSLALHSFTQFLESQRDPQISAPDCSACTSDDYGTHLLKPSHLYSDIDVLAYAPEDLEPSRSFCLDLSGPRVLFCADSVVEIMLKSGASHHLEFKCVDGNFIYSEGKLSQVPDSRDGIFKSRSLGLMEKTQLMKFFKLVQQHFKSDGGHETRISEADLESPFIEFLGKQNLPQKIKSIVLYAIAMADYDQENPEACKNPVKTKAGLETLALYHASIGRFPNALGPFIYPIYGQGELPQAFCRCAAVKGALYVLRMPVVALLTDKEKGSYKGVQLASGQNVFSNHLVLDPSITVPESISSPSPGFEHGDYESSKSGALSNNRVTKIARGVCITRGSVYSSLSNLLVVFPPRSLNEAQVTTVRVLQLNSSVTVCPSGLFILYFSTLCDDPTQGKELINEAIGALCQLPVSENSEKSEQVVTDGGEIEAKPVVLWCASYIQELREGNFIDTVISCRMPDGNLDYKDILKSTIEDFEKMYFQQDLFPEAAGGSGDTEEENVVSD